MTRHIVSAKGKGLDKMKLEECVKIYMFSSIGKEICLLPQGKWYVYCQEKIIDFCQTKCDVFTDRQKWACLFLKEKKHVWEDNVNEILLEENDMSLL